MLQLNIRAASAALLMVAALSAPGIAMAKTPNHVVGSDASQDPAAIQACAEKQGAVVKSAVYSKPNEISLTCMIPKHRARAYVNGSSNNIVADEVVIEGVDSSMIDYSYSVPMVVLGVFALALLGDSTNSTQP
ncbi:MAG: hypothetical protein JNJ84_04510 [Rhodobacteraceae bacterium]|nr:hypothetical protein [Paracoccaceae bacterium]